MIKVLVLSSTLFVCTSCATMQQHKELEERFDALEVQVAELEDNTALLNADYGMFRGNLQRFNRWMFDAVEGMLQHAHTHESLMNE